MKKLIQVLSVIILIGFTYKAGAQTTYTYTGGDVNDVASWTPTPPAIPSGSTDTWYIPTSGSFAFGDDWYLTAGSSIIIGDGVSPVTFIAGGYIYSDDFGQDLSLTVANNATFYVLADDIWSFTFDPASCVFATGSTVNYSYDAADYGSGGSALIGQGDYYNITISQDAGLNGGAITVEHTLSNAATLLMQNGSVTLKGTVTGSGSFSGTAGSTLDIESTGSVGSLNFTSGFQILKKFKIGSGSATLNTDLTVSNVGTGGITSSIFDQSGGSLKLNGHTLTLDVDNNTKFGSSSNVITGSANSALIVKSKTLSSGSLYMDQTNSSTNSLRCLILNGGNSNFLNISNPLNIIDSITVTSGFLNIPTAGDLTLIASQTIVGKTARVGIVGGTFVGSLTSQVYHDPSGNQTNWMLMGNAGIDDGSLTFNDWNANFAITCPTCPYTSVSGTTFNSVQSYDETNGTTFGDALHYNPIGGLSDPITSGQGYWVYLGTANPGTSTPGELISVTGPPKVGGVTINLTNSNTADLTNYGYNLIANPYPSPISWKRVMIANSLNSGTHPENNVYAYSASYNGGDYMVYNAISGISNPALGSTYAIGDIIPTGLGFYVQTDQPAQTLSLSEHVKSSDPTHQILFKGTNQAVNTTQSVSSSSATHYFSLQVTGASNESWASFAFNANATDTTDGYDAFTMGYNGALQISSSTAAAHGKDYAINCVADLTHNYAIPVKILTGATGVYQVTPTKLENMLMGACLNLHDNLTNTDYDLRGGSFSLTLNASDTGARFMLHVTISQLPITTTLKQETCANTNDGLFTVIGNNVGPWNYIWTDANGTVVKTSLNKTTADSLPGLSNGVYNIEVNTVGACDGAYETFTLTAPGLAASIFTAPAQVAVGSTITFTNTSTDATNYSWNFGDGNTASQQTPTYIYNNIGTYTVTLTAINAGCNDTSTSTQIITVDAATGIKQAVAGSGDIFVSKDANGNYLQFNYAGQTKVNITVYNVLGQTILNNTGLNVATDKIYLNLADSKNQVLYVTVTDLTSNIQTTKKFVNN